MAEDGKKPVIKKVIKKGGHGHHGGAWKIAYADFMTAMFAFFLLMWLLNSMTEQQLSGIADYFAPTTASLSKSGAGGMLGGKVIGEGVLSSNSSSSAFNPGLPPPTFNNGESQQDQAPSEDEMQKAQAEKEQQQFEQTADEIRKAIEGVPDLKELGKNLLIDNTPEGLRIQIVDRDGAAMFPSGSSRMNPNMRRLLGLVATAVKDVPKKVAISGHTDSTKYADPNGYGNWELSSDRALASRRVLVEEGFPAQRVQRVVGRSDTDPLDDKNLGSPQNRRISIVLLRDSIAQAEKERATPQSLGITK
ncbi:flagellar motor protein MotB [Oleispirillum naphthae]|uniref:flagellar motor protein MotB n=1 Tax=Oleispirillum naphthae TaxID=2838853 RepID=UPI0030823E42